MCPQILPELPQPRQRFSILLPAARLFAGDDVVDTANTKPFNLLVAAPSVFEAFDAIRRENQIDVERAILELDKVFAAFNISRLLPSD